MVGTGKGETLVGQPLKTMDPGLGGTCETHVPAECAAPGSTARIPAPDDDEKRKGDHQRPPSPWSEKAVGLIERLRGRSAFARLRASGVRTDHGLLWVRHVPDPSLGAARVAYALPRRMGSAVTRNTVRRRLREIVRELDRETEDGLPAGLYLVGTKPAVRQYSHADLRVSMAACLSELDGKTP